MRPLLILTALTLAGCPKGQPSAKPAAPLGTQAVNAAKVAKRQLAGSNIERHHALVLAAQQALKLTDEQVDDLFREGDALV